MAVTLASTPAPTSGSTAAAGQDEPLVKSWRDGPIGRISLNRPGKHNAKNLAMIEALHEAVMAAEADADVRVIVISGEGPSFSSGHDVTEIDHNPAIGAMYDTPEARLATERRMYLDKSLAIRNAAKPTIAQVHGHCIDQHVLQRNVGILIAKDSSRYASPQPRHFEHIGLIDARQPLASISSSFRGSPHDPLDFRDAVNHLVVGCFFAVDGFSPRGPEVDASCQFTEEKDIGPLHDLLTQRRRRQQRVDNSNRSQSREEAELLSDSKQPLLGTHFRIGIIPLRATHRAKQNCI